MIPRRLFYWTLTFALLLCFKQPLLAQSDSSALQARLIGQPLYLRGFWMADNLEFDGAGHLLSKSEQGPFSLSGVEVHKVVLHGKTLTMQGQRVALVANAQGQLERRNISSTTRIFGSLRRSPKNEFIANQEIKLILHADQSSNFDAALATIFAIGLKDFASSVPQYWSCYAEGYFVRNVEMSEAAKIVSDCIQKQNPSGLEAGSDTPADGFTPPTMRLCVTQPRYSQVASELDVKGVSHIHVIVAQNGRPVEFQVVQAVGGGLDEEVLKTVSDSHFQPAAKDGHPVTAGLDFRLKIEVHN